MDRFKYIESNELISSWDIHLSQLVQSLSDKKSDKWDFVTMKYYDVLRASGIDEVDVEPAEGSSARPGHDRRPTGRCLLAAEAAAGIGGALETNPGHA